MTNGYSRFDFYIIQLEALLAQAVQQKDPGAWLYANDCRTTCFMLEGLAKLYSGLHNHRRFQKVKSHFKLLEDALGMIDYYDAFAKEFKSDERVPVTIAAYFRTKADEKTVLFNDILIKEKWIGKKPKRIKRIREKLKGADWKNTNEEIARIADFYHESIEEIKVLSLEAEKGFQELEEEVHELRRQLRWLSIYPRALQGVVQLTDSHQENPKIERYLTPEVINSPFNKMPEAGINKAFVLLEKNNFLALSWLIAALGKLKDNGLRFLALAEALEETESMDKETAERIAGELLGTGEQTVEKVLQNASEICRDFFEGKFLDGLVLSVSEEKF